MSTDLLKRLDAKLYAAVRKVGAAADDRAMEAYIVGGAVRDIFLKQKTCDVDIVVEGDAIALAGGLAKEMKVPVRVYPAFGTASLQVAPLLRLDLVGARKETYPHPGALPVVSPGDLRDDLFRRDFTINAMAICLNKKYWGKPVDEFSGMADLKAKKVRVLHARSFIDDPTRILRAVRFEQRLGFRIESETLRLLKEALKSGQPSTVRPPRYFAEFKKILSGKEPLKGLNRLRRLDGLRFLAPSVRISTKLLQRLQGKMRRAKNIFSAGPWFFYYLALAQTNPVLRRDETSRKFHLTKEEAASLRQLGKARGIVRTLNSKTMRPSEVYAVLVPLNQRFVQYLLVTAASSRAVRQISDFLEKSCLVKLIVDGADLKKIGVPQGKKMGEVLRGLHRLKIDRRISTKDQELRAARRLLAQPESMRRKEWDGSTGSMNK